MIPRTVSAKASSCLAFSSSGSLEEADSDRLRASRITGEGRCLDIPDIGLSTVDIDEPEMREGVRVDTGISGLGSRDELVCGTDLGISLLFATWAAAAWFRNANRAASTLSVLLMSPVRSSFGVLPFCAKSRSLPGLFFTSLGVDKGGNGSGAAAGMGGWSEGREEGVRRTCGIRLSVRGGALWWDL